MSKVYIKIVDEDRIIRRQGKFSVSQNGKRALIKEQGGKGPKDFVFTPEFNKDTEIREEFSRFQRWILLRKNVSYHMVKANAKKCISLKPKEKDIDPDIPDPLPEAVSKAARDKILRSLGGDPKVSNIAYIGIIISILNFVLLLQIGGFVG